MPQLEYITQDSWSGMVISQVLRKKLGFSSALVHTLRESEGSFLLDGQVVPHYTAVLPGQTLVIALPEDPPSEIVPAAGNLDIIFEDAHIVVINKAAGVVVHPGPNHHSDTLGNYLTQHYLDESERHLFRPINRLDKGTSGLLCIAKHAYAADSLRRALHSGAFQRTYYAVCRGTPDPQCGVIELPIGRKDGSVIEREVRPDGQYARTEYQTMRSAGSCSLLLVTPQTGRTHQIRVHLAAIRHPLVGDFLYGTESESIARPALHSHRIAMLHPVTGSVLKFEAPLPNDMQALLE